MAHISLGFALSALLIHFLAAGQALSAPITWSFTGIVTNFETFDFTPPTGETISIGDTVTGSVTYDPEKAIARDIGASLSGVAYQFPLLPSTGPDTIAMNSFSASLKVNESTWSYNSQVLSFGSPQNSDGEISLQNNSTGLEFLPPTPPRDIMNLNISGFTESDATPPSERISSWSVLNGQQRASIQFVDENSSSGNPVLLTSNDLPVGPADLNLKNTAISGGIGSFWIRNDGPPIFSDDPALGPVFEQPLLKTGYEIGFSIDPLSFSIEQGVAPPKTNFSETTLVPKSSEFSIGGDVGDGFDSEAATVIVTHGRQPRLLGTFSYTGNPFDIEALDNAYTAIKHEYPDINVILVTWEGAFVAKAALGGGLASFISSVGDTYDVGIKAAEEIAALASTNTKPIHIIGHSYGSTLNNTIAPELRRLGLNVEQITVLDAPTTVPDFVGVLGTAQYIAAASAASVSLFENYYGNLPFPATLDPAWGEKIPGAERNGGYLLPESHAGVLNRYIDSIEDDSYLLFYRGGGFKESVAISPSIPDLSASTKPTSISGNLVRMLPFSLGAPSITQNAFFDQATSSLSLFEGSDAFAVWGGTDILDVDLFSFTINQMSLGVEDWFEVLLDGKTLAFFDGGTSIFGSQLFLPIDGSSFQSSSLSFLLSGRGDVDGFAVLSGFEFLSLQDVVVAPIPLPASIWMLLFAVGSIRGISFLGSRGHA